MQGLWAAIEVDSRGPWCVTGDVAHRYRCRKCKDYYCELARDEMDPCELCHRMECDRTWLRVGDPNDPCSFPRVCRRCKTARCRFALWGLTCLYGMTEDQKLEVYDYYWGG